jgi:GH24 family phage-related lysozyme (muramidase)
MKNLVDHVRRKDLSAIATEITAMKTLWVGQGLAGLLRRRDDEAALVRGSARLYEANERIYV